MLARVTRTWIGDALVGAAVGALMLFEVVDERLRPYAFSTTFFVLLAVAYGWRRRAPLVVLAIGATGQLVITAAGVPLHKPFSPMILAFLVLYSVALYEPPRRSVPGLALMLAATFAAIAVAQGNGESYGGTDYGFIGVLFAVPWLVGLAIRARVREARALEQRASRLEQERLVAVADERARIARELHDVVAHSVSVMVVQAGAAEEVLKRDAARAADPIRAVQETGRQALVEMSRLVGLLREDGHELGLEPQPGLDALDGLLTQVRQSGLPVDLHVEGTPRPLPLGIDLSAYRIVQEALTNALKHAGRARAEVRLRYAPDAVELEVVDDGSGDGGGHVGGHGLAGMSERVAVFGGEFGAGPREGGGFAVRARLPAGAAVT